MGEFYGIQWSGVVPDGPGLVCEFVFGTYHFLCFTAPRILSVSLRGCVHRCLSYEGEVLRSKAMHVVVFAFEKKFPELNGAEKDLCQIHRVVPLSTESNSCGA